MLNEWTALGLLLGRRREDLVLAGVEAVLPIFQKPLERLAPRLLRRHGGSWLRDLCPEYAHIGDAGSEAYLYNVFEKIEPWLEEHFRFADAENAIGRYAMAYKHAVCDYARQHFYTILALDSFKSRHRDTSVRVSGVPPFLAGAASAFGAAPWPYPSAVTPSWLTRVANAITAVSVAAYSLTWIARRTRPFGVKTEPADIVLDYISHPTCQILAEDLSEAAPLLFIRGQPVSDEERAFVHRFRTCERKDGVFRLGGALRAIAMVIGDGIRLFAQVGDMHPPAYLMVAQLPHKRAILQAFFTRFPTKAYVAQDEDTTDHILRHQELQRSGGRSLGIVHGMGYTLLRATRRYISFDTLFVFGQAATRAYRDTWPKEMELVPIGSHGAKREDYVHATQPRPQDIAVFCSWYVGNPAFEAFIAGLAKEFPDRTVWLQVKRNYAKKDRGRQLIDRLTAAHDNIVFTTDPMYAVIHRVTYAFSDASSAIVEALQLGNVSFFADVHDKHEAVIYRDYPDLCVKTAAGAASRIRDIEDGRWTYPRQSFGDLVDLSGQVFFDVLRADLGQPPGPDPATLAKELNHGGPDHEHHD